MKWKIGALLSILALWACEGGTRGSGISTLLEGNVASVQSAAHLEVPHTAPPSLLAELREFFTWRTESAAHAQSGLEGIQVMVEGTALHGQTDANGHFSLQGQFAGPLAVLFAPATGGGTARLETNAPEGGTVTLNDVQVDTAQGEATAETQDVMFFATIDAIDCQGLTLTLFSFYDTSDQVPYTLQLATSSLEDARGNALSCADLRIGQRAQVNGMVNPDLTFGNAVVRVHK